MYATFTVLLNNKLVPGTNLLFQLYHNLHIYQCTLPSNACLVIPVIPAAPEFASRNRICFEKKRIVRQCNKENTGISGAFAEREFQPSTRID